MIDDRKDDNRVLEAAREEKDNPSYKVCSACMGLGQRNDGIGGTYPCPACRGTGRG